MIGDSDAIRRFLASGHYHDVKPTEVEADIGFLLQELDTARDAAHDAVIATVARIRTWMALDGDKEHDLDGLLDAILKDAP